jgi:hypothetical protein
MKISAYQEFKIRLSHENMDVNYLDGRVGMWRSPILVRGTISGRETKGLKELVGRPYSA